MIVFDTETTGLTQPDAAPLEQQPYIVEFAAIKLNDGTLEEEDRMEFLCKPRIAIPADSEKITGISNAMVSSYPPFSSRIHSLSAFFLGEALLIAHNITFDIRCLEYELRRYNCVTAFPYPPRQVCTVELSVQLRGYRMKLQDLYEDLTGGKYWDAHRAMPDVEALVKVVRVLRGRGLI